MFLIQFRSHCKNAACYRNRIFLPHTPVKQAKLCATVHANSGSASTGALSDCGDRSSSSSRRPAADAALLKRSQTHSVTDSHDLCAAASIVLKVVIGAKTMDGKWLRKT